MPRDAREEAGAAAAALRRIEAADTPELAALWAARHGAPPPSAMPERLLRLALAWALQVDADSTSARRLARRLDRLAASGGAETRRARRQASPRLILKPGTALVRDWGGRTHRVEALAGGSFAWAGRDWRSLSSIARAITGTRRNGPAFFGLREVGRDGES